MRFRIFVYADPEQPAAFSVRVSPVEGVETAAPDWDAVRLPTLEKMLAGIETLAPDILAPSANEALGLSGPLPLTEILAQLRERPPTASRDVTLVASDVPAEEMRGRVALLRARIPR